MMKYYKEIEKILYCRDSNNNLLTAIIISLPFAISGSVVSKRETCTNKGYMYNLRYID